VNLSDLVPWWQKEKYYENMNVTEAIIAEGICWGVLYQQYTFY
jgi:hypothetical protein